MLLAQADRSVGMRALATGTNQTAYPRGDAVRSGDPFLSASKEASISRCQASWSVKKPEQETLRLSSWLCARIKFSLQLSACSRQKMEARLSEG